MRERIHLSCGCRNCQSWNKYIRKKISRKRRRLYKENFKKWKYDIIELSTWYI